MPNYRDPDKTHTSAWVRKDLKSALQALSRERNATVSDVIVTLLEDEVERWRNLEEEAAPDRR
jgi:hypothetical protein